MTQPELDNRPLMQMFNRWNADPPNPEVANALLAEYVRSDCRELQEEVLSLPGGPHGLIKVEKPTKTHFFIGAALDRLLPEGQARPTDWHVSISLPIPTIVQKSEISMFRFRSGSSQERKSFSFRIDESIRESFTEWSYLRDGAYMTMRVQDANDLLKITKLAVYEIKA